MKNASEFRKFEKITKMFVNAYRKDFIKVMSSEKFGNNAALLLVVGKKNNFNNQIKADYFIISESYNSYLYNKLPFEIKTRIEDNPDKTYVIFINEKGVTCCYKI